MSEPGENVLFYSNLGTRYVIHLSEFVWQVTRQLFEPLVMQLIHWFTNNKKFESQDTVAVLEAILVSIQILPRDF